MNEYEELLEEYSSDAYRSFNQIVPEIHWGNKKVAINYCEKYWLNKSEYDKNWKPIQDNIFLNYDKGLPHLKFNNNYKVINTEGGHLLNKKEFIKLKECFNHTNDKNFVVIENDFGNEKRIEPLRMKYSVNIEWDELISGNFISSAILDNSANEYFVFGDSSIWGIYAANDYVEPMNIIGCKSKFRSLFNEIFSEFRISE